MISYRVERDRQNGIRAALMGGGEKRWVCTAESRVGMGSLCDVWGFGRTGALLLPLACECYHPHLCASPVALIHCPIPVLKKQGFSYKRGG
jgi:hypothetical protein